MNDVNIFTEIELESDVLKLQSSSNSLFHDVLQV